MSHPSHAIFILNNDGEPRCLECDCRQGGSASREPCRARTGWDFETLAQDLDQSRHGHVKEGSKAYARLGRLASFLRRQDARTATLGEAIHASWRPDRGR